MRPNSDQTFQPLLGTITNIRRRAPLLGIGMLLLVASLFASACQGESDVPTSTDASNRSIAEDGYLLFNQDWLDGLSSDPVDLEDVDATFWHVFSGLKDEVTVYPSENYYYFSLYANGRQIWGNIRLPSGRRERGVLSFGYFEFRESPFETSERLTRFKFFTQADGLIMEELDRFTYKVSYNGRDVIFNFHELSQEPPNLFDLGEDEVFIERTFDESGYQYFLLFNERLNHFLWVLNEEENVPDILEARHEDLLVGKRSGFAFWVDAAHDDRKVLFAIRGQSATRNDYYDGPFDQLADNYALEVGISDYMEKASPSLKGRIDPYGYFLDRERGRVSISPYFVYFTMESLENFLTLAKASDEPYRFISRGRASLTATPTPTAN